MSITHNLSNTLDLQSCLDPVDGLSDGTTIGKSYLIRKIFDNFLATHPTAKEITNASPTPAFLQDADCVQWGSYYTIPTDVAVERSSAGDHVRFYFTDDPGLSQATPNCIVYTFCIHPTYSGHEPIMHITVSHKVSGSAIQLLQYGSSAQPFSYPYSSDSYSASLKWFYSGTTTTSFSNIPKVLIWCSSNAIYLSTWSRTTGGYVSGFMIYRPTWTGYTKTEPIVNGQNVNIVLVTGWNSDWIFYHPMSKHIEYTSGHWDNVGTSYFPSRCQVVSNLGRLPSIQYTIDGVLRLITGKFAITTGYSELCANSGEIEGILIANPEAALATGQIGAYNGTSRYLSGMNIQDGMNIHKMLFQLT